LLPQGQTDIKEFLVPEQKLHHRKLQTKLPGTTQEGSNIDAQKSLLNLGSSAFRVTGDSKLVRTDGPLMKLDFVGFGPAQGTAYRIPFTLKTVMKIPTGSLLSALMEGRMI
jgi:hypothetical protein